MITKQAHNLTLVLMREPSGGTSWVDSNFVQEKEAEGYACVTTETPVEAVSEPVEEAMDLGDLSSKAKKELVALGKKRGIDVKMTMSKDQMIVELEGA